MPVADEQRTQVLPTTGGQPAVEESSPGAAWVKGDREAKPEQPAAFAAQPAPVRDLPAGVDAGDLSVGPPASARRGKLRRRLRYLRRVRELLLRDLGGFTYEVHRTAAGAPHETHLRLAEAKANRISALDAEVAAIEAHLGEPHAEPVLREAGIGGTCPECGELHASDARFCSRCGAPLDAKARAQREAVAEPEPAAEPPPASVLWAGGLRPTDREEAEADKRSAVTSQWLIGERPTTFDRPAGDEPAPASESAAAAHEPAPPADEPATATGGEEPVADGPAPTGDEPAATGDEPAAAAGDEPAPRAAAGEPATTTGGEEPATVADEPLTADMPAATTDEPAAVTDEPAATTDEPAAVTDEPTRDEAAAAGYEAKDDAKSAEGFAPGPNGRRGEDVPSPVTSGDPLPSRREQTP